MERWLQRLALDAVQGALSLFSAQPSPVEPEGLKEAENDEKAGFSWRNASQTLGASPSGQFTVSSQIESVSGDPSNPPQSFSPDIPSLISRLRLASHNATVEIQASSKGQESEELMIQREVTSALRRYDLGLLLLEDETAEFSYTYGVLEDAKRRLEKLRHHGVKVPVQLDAHLDLGMALAIFGSEDDPILNGNRKLTRLIRHHLEAALPVMRSHSDDFGIETVADTLMMLAHCELGAFQMSHLFGTHWAKAGVLYREAVQWLDSSREPTLRLKHGEYSTLLAACLHMQRHPAWPAAVRAVQEAIETFEALNQEAELADALRQLAWICQAMPESNFAQAELAYQETLSHLHSPNDRELRADTLARLADCLNEDPDKPETPWERLAEIMEEVVSLRRQVLHEEQTPPSLASANLTKNRKKPKMGKNQKAVSGQSPDISAQRSDAIALTTLDELPESMQHFLTEATDYAELLKVLPIPQMEKAAALYSEMLAWLPASLVPQRAFVAYQQALCLERQSEPDWNAALEASAQAVAGFRRANHQADLIAALQQRGFLLFRHPETLRVHLDESISVYRELTVLLDQQPIGKPENRRTRKSRLAALATAFYNLTVSLNYFLRREFADEPPEESLDQKRWQEANDAVWKAAQLFEENRNRMAWADAVRLAFRLARRHPELCSEAHIQTARRVLRLLKADLFPVKRAELLYCLSFVLYTEPRRQWAKALPLSEEAAELLREERPQTDPVDTANGADDLAEVLGQLASIYQTQPHPDLERAVFCYREAISHMTGPDDRLRRAETLYLLSMAFIFHGEASERNWEASNEALTEAVTLLNELQNDPLYLPERLERTLSHALPLLALGLFTVKPARPDEAIRRCRQALPCLPADSFPIENAQMLMIMAHSLTRQELPQHLAALDAIQQAVGVLERAQETFPQGAPSFYDPRGKKESSKSLAQWLGDARRYRDRLLADNLDYQRSPQNPTTSQTEKEHKYNGSS